MMRDVGSILGDTVRWPKMEKDILHALVHAASNAVMPLTAA